MRLLALALVIASGCYDPSIDDCQFKCGSNQDCPDGTRCMGGSCRSMTTGMCPSVTGDSGIACNGAPNPPSVCGAKTSLDGVCVVVCANDGGDQRSWDNAKSSCESVGWELAVLDSATKLSGVNTGGDNDFWVGASRTVALWSWESGTSVSTSAWPNNTEPVGGNDCAALDGSSHRLRNDIGCDNNQRYVCTWPQR